MDANFNSLLPTQLVGDIKFIFSILVSHTGVF